MICCSFFFDPKIKIITYGITMVTTGTLTNNYAGMQYRVSGLTEGDKIVRLTVTDEHTNVEGDLTNPASSTGGG